MINETEVKPKKPIWKKWWFWLIAVFVIIIIASAGGGEKKEIAPVTEEGVVEEEVLDIEPTPGFEPEPESAEEPEKKDATPKVAVSGTLTAHFIDVGQGDATLLSGPDFTIVIDAGQHTGNEVVPYLKSAGVSSIDLLIGTHPHADHIGQFTQILQEFTVGTVWMSGDTHTSLTFERALDAILASNATYHEPRSGETKIIGSAIIEVVNPNRLTGDFHEGSVSVRIRYGNVNFLFTGDIEAHTERAMVNRGHILRAQILQVGHHGSRTSSDTQFLQAVRPEVAIYSAGIGNTYGHPHQEAINRLTQAGAKIYGTDVNGTIRVTTDGTTYQVRPSRGSEISTIQPSPKPEPEPEPESTPAVSDCIDINTASKEQLMKIIHIGDIRANQLISLRPFSSVDQLTRIDGIGPARLTDIKNQGLACVR